MDDLHYNPDFLVNHTKDGINSEKASKRLCKVLKFSSEFSLIENLNYISMLNPTLFPCLFVFVIEIKSLNEFQEIQIEDHFFYRFDKTRPIVLQIKAGNDSKWFYSEENKTQFVCINEGHDDYMHLSILLWKFSKNNNKQDIEEFIDVLIDEFSDIKNTSTVLRFLTNLTISDETLFSIMLQCALNGSQDEFSSFLNDSFDKEHRIFNANTQKLMSYYQIDEATQNKISVLLQAVENPRGDVIDYLISNCTHLIQELPYHHRVKVSEYAMTINKFGILCDLLEFSDFPFPHVINDFLILNERFSKISNDRKLFHKSICDDNIDQIQSFINKNQNLKFAFNIDNKSALACAMELKKFKTYTDLKSKGFKINDGEIKDYEKDLKKKELMEWKKQIWIQTQKNVAEAKLDPKKLIYHFKSRSLIHKRMITKEAEAKNRTKIEEMFENINKIPICSKFLLVASQCEDLKFIFDFDSESTNNLPDVSNLFISSESFQKSEIFENFKSITCENQNIKVIIDCSRGSNNYFKQLNDLNLKLIVVLGNKNQLIELEEMLTSQHFSQSKAVKELYFTFEDLTVECQLSLVQKKIKFQNNSNLTLEEILTNNVAESFDDGLYKKIIDDELLKLLVENPLVSINTNSKTGDDDKFFDILFQPRNLVNTKSGLNEVVSEDSLFANVNSMKNILISDLGGTGKSWMLKKITQILNKKVPKTWVSYIDLKQHIQAFKKMHTKSYFPHFLGEEIIKLESNYEKQIFNCLFENGRTTLLFDGFDEISQDCAKNLLNLLKSFESNNGNQLWIATRNYCEEYLQNEINFDATFNLEEITEENGIDLVIHTWLLEETPNIENDLKSHHNYAKYKKMVENLGSKLPKKKGRPIGFPLFYKMIANVYSNEKDSIDILTVFVIVHGFVTQQCRRWMSEKGECGIEAAIKSQNKNYGYFLIHQLLALRSMFPEKKKICSLDYDKHKWSDKCINNCGLATKNGGLVYFQHEIIREFFVAMFILDILRQSPDSIDEDFISLLKDLFTNYKFNVIRIFINDGIIQDTETIDSNHQANVSLENITEQLICERVLLKLFKEGHVNLMKIFMPLTPSSDHYEMVEGTLNQTIKEIIEITQSNEKIIEILKLIINFLTDDDLKNLFWEQEIFQNIMKLRSDITILETIAAMLEIKTGKLFVEKLLEKKCLDNRNCFYFLYKSDYCDEKNFKILFLFLQKYLSKCVIVKMIKQCDNNTNNILHICVKMMNVEKLKIMWKEIQNVCDSLKSLLCFKELIIQNESILHVAASCDNEHFHETLWTLIHQTYPEMNELSKLIIHKDKSGSSFLDLLVKNKNHKILECSLNFIIRIPFKDILNLKNKDGKNLLHFSICTCKTDTRIHNILWNHLKHQIVSSNIVKEILLQTDNEDNTIFELMAIHSSKKVFTFIIQNIISILEEEFITILKCLNNQKKNLIQIAVKNNFDLEFHEQLWKVLNKYLDSNDILKIIQSIDTSGNTLLMLAVLYNNQSCVELTWNEIANHVKGKIERHEYLNIVGLEGISLLDLSRKNRFKGVNLFVGELLNKITINGHPYGEALNLLKFEKDNKVVVDIKKLQSILEQKDVRNRKIVAFSIIGAMRKGKSYFLNYCLRFLYANVSNTSIFN
ncbi:unnamed protein product [Chironomus riparius]|uniref:NACHT domain-containing protein n=1 Tax=Chironomus riparius TaxID=315576 RepID=A0A9P0JGP7_9DIPT|nr:unnamed protein product [Chironomus riparius]